MDICFGPPDRSPALPGTAMQQHPYYAATLAALGRNSVVADIHAEGAHIGRAQVFERRFGPLRAAWLPRGPVWATDTPHDLRRAALRRLPGLAPWRALWAATPDHGRAPGLRIAPAPVVAELDLTADSATRRAAQHGKWRNRLCRAEAAGLDVTLRSLNLPRDAQLLMREVAQRAGRGYSGLPPAFTENWPRKATLLATARSGGDIVAFMLILLHAPTASYHMGWSGEHGRAANAHTLLLWRISEHLARHGYARLDLGSVDAQRAPGLARFKTGSGAALRRLGETRLSARLI